MLHENPFGVAEREGAERGVCPVTLLDEFFTNHTAFDEICAEFACKICVATDEDMGLGGEHWPPSAQPSDGRDWEIPF